MTYSRSRFCFSFVVLRGEFFDDNINDNYLEFLTKFFWSLVNYDLVYLLDLQYLVTDVCLRV